MTTIRLPRGIASWPEYQDRYGVDRLGDVLRCRRCQTEWAIEHNRGKMLQRMHRCPSGCNGPPRRKRVGYTAPKPVVDHLKEQWENSHGWKGEGWEYDGPEYRGDPLDTPEERMEAGRLRRRPTNIWFAIRQAGPARFAELDRFFAEAAEQPDPFRYVQDRES